MLTFRYYTAQKDISLNQCADMTEWESGDHVSCGPLGLVITTSTACFSEHLGGKGTVLYVTLSPAFKTNSPSILQWKRHCVLYSCVWLSTLSFLGSCLHTYSDMWTKMSVSPLSGTINPWPLALQKFLHIPVWRGESEASLDLRQKTMFSFFNKVFSTTPGHLSFHERSKIIVNVMWFENYIQEQILQGCSNVESINIHNFSDGCSSSQLP